ncbi:hypothetical protein WJU23_18145 [Prosthecobacter sp. SYSU 5D2]|uniref:hypothetical protein n=1 Tax=Prosthecobacter sp. SYSU 5D2 TaxID=3134134 RepID=UPI0031FE496D
MNHAHSPAARLAAPMLYPGLVQRLAVSVKDFLCGSDELPSMRKRARRPYATEQAWTVTSTLVQQTAFGILSADACYEVTAKNKAEALALAANEIRESYPGYAITQMRAFSASEG